MSEAMTKLGEALVWDLVKILYDVSPIYAEIDGGIKKIRFHQLGSGHIQSLYDQANAAIVFMSNFESVLEVAAKAAVNEKLEELIAAQVGAGQNAEKPAQI